MAKKKPWFQLTAGDSCKLLPARKTDGVANLIIADPPFNFGYEYASSIDDKLPRAKYLEWTREWMTVATERLHKHGSMWVFCPDEWVSEIDLLARDSLGYTKRRHVVWTFTFGQAAQNNFTRSHCHILYLTRTKTKFTFNEAAIRVPSARQLVYNDKRANSKGKLPDATWILLKAELEKAIVGDSDVWLESRVCGTYKERNDLSPNQIPVPVMERIVLATSNPGDLVLDPFGGTFSSGKAALKHDRNYIGYELSKTAVDVGRKALGLLGQRKD